MEVGEQRCLCVKCHEPDAVPGEDGEVCDICQRFYGYVEPRAGQTRHDQMIEALRDCKKRAEDYLVKALASRNYWLQVAVRSGDERAKNIKASLKDYDEVIARLQGVIAKAEMQLKDDRSKAKLDGTDVKKARLDAGLSIRQLARLVHVDHAYLVRVESGEKPVSERLAKWASGDLVGRT